MASSKEKFALPMGVSLSVPTRTSPRKSAEIEAHEIIIHGEVIGTLKGERVQISSTGRVTGDMETRGIVIEDGAVLRSKVQGCQENQPAQLSPPAVAPRAKEVAAVGGAQASNRSSEAGDFFIVARCAASSSATFPIMREPAQPRQDSRHLLGQKELAPVCQECPPREPQHPFRLRSSSVWTCGSFFRPCF